MTLLTEPETYLTIIQFGFYLQDGNAEYLNLDAVRNLRLHVKSEESCYKQKSESQLSSSFRSDSDLYPTMTPTQRECPSMVAALTQ